MKSLLKLITKLVFDFVAILTFFATIVALVYAIMFTRKHQFANIMIALAVVLISALLGIGFSWLAAHGNKKHFQHNIANNFWINLLPPW